MRDLPHSIDLLVLGRELLLDELLPLLPAERHRDVRLIATVMAIVAREAAGEGWEREVQGELAAFYSDAAPHPNPLPACGERERGFIPSPRLRGEGADPGFDPGEAGEGRQQLRRLAADLRNGAFETSPSRAAAARAILWSLTIEKLREGNPHFLAANGLAAAGDEGA